MPEPEIDQIDVSPVPEPDQPDEGELDPADTYTEGLVPEDS